MSGATTGVGRGLLVAFLAVAGVLGAGRALLRPDPERRNFEFLPEMVRSPAAESQSTSALFPDGLVQRPLPEGVVPRGTPFLPFGPGDEEADRAGRELVNPLDPGDAAALARGARLFSIHCVVCHDARGEGQGPAVLRGMLAPTPFKGDRAMLMKDGQVFHAITFGRGNMASYAAAVEPADRWALVLHVRALQGAGVPK